MNFSSSDAEVKKIAFIYTELQRSVFNTVVGPERGRFIVIYPSHRKEIPDGSGTFIPVVTSDQRLSLKTSRALSKEISLIIEGVTSGCDYELWLASCDNPIGQLLVNHACCARTVLIEDGIGSYVKHAPLDADKGFRAFARKLKYFLYLFPKYRSIYGIGSQVAEEYWAIHESAFPRAGVEPRVVKIEDFKRNLPISKMQLEVSHGAVLYLDQPLTRLSISFASVASTLEKHIREISEKYGEVSYFVKRHPVSTEEEIEKLIELFSKVSGRPVHLISCNDSVESMVVSEAFCPREVFSFLSSALYTIKSLRPDIYVRGVLSKDLVSTAPYISKYVEAMRGIGVGVDVYD